MTTLNPGDQFMNNIEPVNLCVYFVSQCCPMLSAQPHDVLGFMVAINVEIKQQFNEIENTLSTIFKNWILFAG